MPKQKSWEATRARGAPTSAHPWMSSNQTTPGAIASSNSTRETCGAVQTLGAGQGPREAAAVKTTAAPSSGKGKRCRYWDRLWRPRAATRAAPRAPGEPVCGSVLSREPLQGSRPGRGAKSRHHAPGHQWPAEGDHSCSRRARARTPQLTRAHVDSRPCCALSHQGALFRITKPARPKL